MKYNINRGYFSLSVEQKKGKKNKFKFTEREKNIFWIFGGTYLLTVNIIRMLWLISTQGILQSLWLSQIIGIIEGIMFFTKAKHPVFNGFYLELAFFPFMGFLIYIPLGTDILFYFSHFPHIFIVYLLYYREKINIKGFHISAVFMLFVMNISWWIQYKVNYFGYAINTTTSIYFPLVLIFSLVWYLFVFLFFNRKPNVKKGLEYKRADQD